MYSLFTVTPQSRNRTGGLIFRCGHRVSPLSVGVFESTRVILVTRFQFVYMYYPWSRFGAPADQVVYGRVPPLQHAGGHDLEGGQINA